MQFRIIILIIILFFSFCSYGQFYEDFSSESFTTNDWQGDINNFKISTSTAIPLTLRPALQLDDDISNTSYISAPYELSLSDSIEWNFWVKLSFNTTTNNHSRVYIVSNQSDIKANLNGYFVGIGETEKKITLVKQNGSELTTLITGSIAELSSTTNEIRVRVVRNVDGEWKLYFSQNIENPSWIFEGSATDTTFTSSQWHGLYCKYTSSNSTKIYFDEFYVGNVILDTIKPSLDNINVISQFQLDIIFNKAIDSASALNLNNYSINNGIGSPNDIIKDASNPLLYHLSFSLPFPENTVCKLNVSNIYDIGFENFLDNKDFEFVYYLTKIHDIVINEIMADPSPIVNLPDYEFIELFNRTSLPINLNNWKLIFGTTSKTLNNVVIPANGYLIICGSNAIDEFSSYGNVYDIGSTSITNSGQTITLVDQFHNLVHSISFEVSWHNEKFKEDGGWSLEMIDPNNPCAESSNWGSSINQNGGTPGKINSIFDNNIDNSMPELLRVSVISDSQIRLWFSEKMDSIKLKSSLSYSLSHGLTIVGSPILVFPNYKSVILNLSQSMQNTVIYNVTITDTLYDCVENAIEINSSAKFALSENIEVNDIIINEVLSNPPPGLNEFVEIYNKSEKILDLKDLFLANIDNNTNEVSSITTISEDGFLFFPEDFIVMSKNVQGIKDYYYCKEPNNFIQMSSLPAYNNSNGNVIIRNKLGEIIDRFDYDESMHFPMLKSYKGVSFERINYNRPTNDITNWSSASETIGFATPGYINSQYSENNFNGEITIYPEIFSPDNDGYNDNLNISYEFPTNENVGNIRIYDSRGRLIKNLAENQLLGTSGTYSWNGTTNDNQKAVIGIYIILFETFDIYGNTNTTKKTAVLGSRLN